MADIYGASDGGDEFATPVVEKKPKGDRTDEQPKTARVEVDHVEAMAQFNRGWTHDQHNIEREYADLNFLAGFQWLQELENQRLQDARPVLTFNRLPQFVRQVTGDIRQMKPAIKVVPVAGGDEKIAEIREGLIRHIENASNAALEVYVDAADSQVACGIGHWEIAGEYSDELSYEQDIVIRTLDDQIAVIWDPDARKKTREDANFCFVPIDMTREAYKENYPDHPINDMDNWDGQYIDNWYSDDRVRVCRYWYKKKITRKLVKLPTGEVIDVTEPDPEQMQLMQTPGAEPFEREGFEIYWRMMNCVEFLTEPKKWPGRYIPIVPLIGEEVRVGNRRERHGIVRFAADPQRAYNYARSTQTEFVGLQPKAPFIGTEENFKDYGEEWDTANVKNWPYLRYTPDPKNGSIAPQRQAPPTASSGLSECILAAEADMQAVIGIYNASLGAKSNETSGVAIKSREKQGDTGTYVYIANFALAVTHTARVINDLIPYYYDTARVIRIMGEDGKSKQVPINQPAMPLVMEGASEATLNDITVGTYDIQMELGPSYNTAREEARDGMTAFIQAFPPAAPLIADKVAKLMDWPGAEEISERLETLLPPQIQAKIAEKDNKPPPPPPEPNPIEMAKAQAEIAKSQSVAQTSELDVRMKELELARQQLLNVKAELDVMEAQAKLGGMGDIASLKAQAAKMDDAIRFLSDHVATQIAAEEAPQGMQNTANVSNSAQNSANSAPEPMPPASPVGHPEAISVTQPEE
jgi:hypothetical protein